MNQPNRPPGPAQRPPPHQQGRPPGPPPGQGKPGGPPPPDFRARVARLCEETAKTCRKVGLHAAAVELPEEGATSRVLVVGDAGAGKSRFLGSLIGAPGLLPVDTQHCQITLRHGDPLVTVSAADGSMFETTLAELAQLASHPIPPRPVGVDVSLRSRVLPGLEIVDLPGVDGLAGAQGRAALTMADTADAVLLVHDSNGPIREGELSFLTEVADRVACVALIFNKTDVAPDYMVVMEHARRILSRTPALRSVALFDASGANYERSKRQAAIGGRLVEPLRRFSGMDPIREFLARRVAGRGTQLRLASAARECAGLLRRCAEIVERDARLGDEAEAASADKALVALLASESTVRGQLRGHVQGLRSAPRAQLDAEIRNLREELRAFAEKSPTHQFQTLPERVQAGLVVVTSRVWTTQTDAAIAATEVLTERLRGTDELEQMRMTLAQTDLSESVAAGIGAGVGSPSAAYARSLKASSRATMTRTALMMVPGVIAGMFTGGAALGLGLAAVAGTGVGAMAWGQGRATDAQYRQHVRQWVDQTVTEAQRSLTTALETRAQTLSSHLEARLVELLAAARTEREHIKAFATSLKNDPELLREREHAAHLRKGSASATLLADQITGAAPPPS